MIAMQSNEVKAGLFNRRRSRATEAVAKIRQLRALVLRNGEDIGGPGGRVEGGGAALRRLV